ncbi:MAG: phosphoglucosamine mutase [Candidatus Latescibacteria bacterium 4484_7]|nr:MAG: phosphoglucosamine mutase [Candidatus Latescibacteria bacterium 4484_7]
MVSVSGVRGLVGVDMNPEVAARFTAAFSRHTGCKTVVIGRDTRPSGAYLAESVIAALRFNGVSVIDIGISATPTVELMVKELKADGGIIITASHNGPEWNALKFLNSEGEFPSSSVIEAIKKLVESDESLFRDEQRFGSLVSEEGADSRHISRILELDIMDRSEIADAGFSAVVDCVNGGGSRIVPALLRSLGVDVKELFTDIDAPFPHVPEPRPENLIELSETMKRVSADIGFAVDPDADRLVLADAVKGVRSEELTLALVVDFVLSREKGPVVVNMSTSRIIDDICASHGVPLYRSKVGEANVSEMMKDVGAVVGGEGNGGVIYPGLHYGRDAMVGMALILRYLVGENASFAEKLDLFDRYTIVKKKVPFNGNLDDVFVQLENDFRGKISTLDGIRIDMDEGWIHVRKSNTEPVVRIIAEARKKERAEELVGRVEKILERSSL